MDKFSEITDGIINSLTGGQEVKEEAKRRLKICYEPDGYEPHCRYWIEESLLMGPRCGKCGCVLK